MRLFSRRAAHYAIADSCSKIQAARTLKMAKEEGVARASGPELLQKKRHKNYPPTVVWVGCHIILAWAGVG